MQSLYDVPAPAKLNLFLHITGRRTDGYHLMQSAFMLIDWCDTLHFELRADGIISREDLSVALPPDDLVVRAARALQHASQCPLGVHIGVHKSIPAQAGLGGGSSDAASTLLALNRLWNTRLPLATLAALALQLGADVPFFLSGGHAWIEGIGEVVTPLSLPVARFAVVKPPQGLETRLIFSDPSPQTRLRGCYNFRLRCRRVWFWPKRLAGRGAKTLSGCIASDYLAGLQGPRRPDDRFRKCGFCPCAAGWLARKRRVSCGRT